MKVFRCTILLLLLCSSPSLLAQGVRVWNHGKYLEYRGENVDSLVFFEKEEPSSEESQENILNGHEWQDLGLPSHTLWARTNIGAESPEEYGDYFSWGEVEKKNVFSLDKYKYNQDTEGFTKYVPKSQKSFGYKNFSDDKTELMPSDDAAHVIWGTGWRIPSYEQMKELVTCCTWVWDELDGKKGYKVYGPNGQHIFIPAAGFRTGTRQMGVGNDAYLWFRNLYSPMPSRSWSLYLNESAHYMSNSTRSDGQSIRPVRVEVRIVDR